MKSLKNNHKIIIHPLISSLQKLALYENKSKFYIVASNNMETKFQVLYIDRMESHDLKVTCDGIEYSRNEIKNKLDMIDVGNRGRSGGSSRVIGAFGIVGFVRFLEGYYLILVTKRRRVAKIGLHSIYKIEDTAMIYIPNESVRISHSDEPRCLKMFQSIDLSSNFYFSYSYDITHTLQVNLAIPENIESITTKDIQIKEPSTNQIGPVEVANEDFGSVVNKKGINEGRTNNLQEDKNIYFQNTSFTNGTKFVERVSHYAVRSEPNERFVWNSYLLSKVKKTIHPDWILNVMHGFISQSNVSVFGRSIYLTLIARRSNKYAGTRFLKRGANFEGDVANEVETEQLVEDMGVSSIESPKFSSFVQMRGSIPGHWSQNVTKMVPKPAISFDLSDPYCQAAGAHFNNLLLRYGSPIIVLNLVKKREKKKHESILSEEYSGAIKYLNQFLPPEHQIYYISFDMARMNKGKEANVMGRLAAIARAAISKTGLYCSHDAYKNQQPSTILGKNGCPGRIQTGIIRVNCVDCLDRTNTAQFALGKCALGYQLCAMGLLERPNLDFDSDCVRLLEVLYEDHGDTLALQYGGSQLVHRIKTYRKTAPWTSQGNDIMQTLSRYYSNTFSDAEKQHAMNLFLGLFVPTEHSAPIWEQVTDYYLHQSLTKGIVIQRKYPLTQWWDPEVMNCLPYAYTYKHKQCKSYIPINYHDIECVDVYNDFYKPHEFSVLKESLAEKISHSVRDFMPNCVTDYSPFTVRVRPGRRREEATKGGNKNPSLTGLSSTSSTTSSGSSGSESDEEDELDVQITDSHHTSPARDLPTPSLVTFESLFPSMRQIYGVEIKNPSRPDTLSYKRFVQLGYISNQMNVQPKVINICNLMIPSVVTSDSSLKVAVPKVSPTSIDIYKNYVTKSNGIVNVDDEKYKQYLNCELGLFRPIGWE
uniref:SAC domain-containing protein n=1 Tax=Clastoptera arizonana TaxID=38151 RepID=A0A1B6BYX7_9HEMI